MKLGKINTIITHFKTFYAAELQASMPAVGDMRKEALWDTQKIIGLACLYAFRDAVISAEKAENQKLYACGRVYHKTHREGLHDVLSRLHLVSFPDFSFALAVGGLFGTKLTSCIRKYVTPTAHELKDGELLSMLSSESCNIGRADNMQVILESAGLLSFMNHLVMAPEIQAIFDQIFSQASLEDAILEADITFELGASKRYDYQEGIINHCVKITPEFLLQMYERLMRFSQGLTMAQRDHALRFVSKQPQDAIFVQIVTEEVNKFFAKLVSAVKELCDKYTALLARYPQFRVQVEVLQQKLAAAGAGPAPASAPAARIADVQGLNLLGQAGESEGLATELKHLNLEERGQVADVASFAAARVYAGAVLAPTITTGSAMVCSAHKEEQGQEQGPQQGRHSPQS